MKQIIIKRSDKHSWHLFLDNILMASFHETDFTELSAYVLSYLEKLEYNQTLPLENIPKHSPFGEDFVKKLEKMTKKGMIETIRNIRYENRNRKCN